MRIAFVDGGTYYHHATYHDADLHDFFSKHIYILDLPNTELSDTDVLYIASRHNPQDLINCKSVITNFLDQGKMVIAMGESGSQYWLDSVSLIPGITNFWWWLTPGADSGLRLMQPEHELFHYISLADATWHRHGTLTPPAGAVSLIDAVEGGSVLYDDCTSSAGRLIVTTLDPCYHHGSYFMPATTRFLKGFLRWLYEIKPVTAKSSVIT